MAYSGFTDEMIAGIKAAAIESVIPKWVRRAGGADSEAARLFNETVGPLVSIRINPDGTVQLVP